MDPSLKIAVELLLEEACKRYRLSGIIDGGRQQEIRAAVEKVWQHLHGAPLNDIERIRLGLLLPTET